MRKESVHNAWLNGIALSSVDASIVVRPATEDMSNASLSYIANAGRSGRRIAKYLRESRVVRVRFSIKGLYNLSERARIVDSVNAWAYAGGVLQISSRLGQQIEVTCIKYAATSGMMLPSDVYELEFEANICPYWEDSDLTRVVLAGTSKSNVITIPGNVMTVVEAVVTPTEGTLNSLDLTVTSSMGISGIALSNLEISSGNIVIGYDANRFFKISYNNYSLLQYRSSNSSDELYSSSGSATVGFIADTAVSTEFKVRGRWL